MLSEYQSVLLPIPNVLNRVILTWHLSGIRRAVYPKLPCGPRSVDTQRNFCILLKKMKCRWTRTGQFSGSLT